MNFSIPENIRQACTLPSDFYRSPQVFEHSKEAIFASTWHYVADSTVIETSGQVYPFTLLPGVLQEPLVLTCDKNGTRHCLSNVCTHRGKIVVEQPSQVRQLSCGYHGRCFRLDGSFKSMPEFEQVENFPTEADNLTQVPFAEWLGMVFVSVQPRVSFAEMIRPMQERLSWLPVERLELVAEASKDYFTEAHWALYCDNYLEGFHIPFVHPALNQALDFAQYDYEIFPYCNLQIGIADAGQPHFDLPESSPDFGKKVYAYYFWVFPNLMFNFYPWGLSLNVVQPLNHKQTKISFRTYRFPSGAYTREVNRIDETELEDEAVVESVQQGIQSRFYKQGRFSPTMEKGVHHFHRLVEQFLNG